MPKSGNNYCPEWCTTVHNSSDTIEDNLVIHSKGFGSLWTREVKPVKVWAAYQGGKIYSTGIAVDFRETCSSENVRALAQDCLDAAQWMEVSLPPLNQAMAK